MFIVVMLHLKKVRKDARFQSALNLTSNPLAAFVVWRNARGERIWIQSVTLINVALKIKLLQIGHVTIDAET